MRKNIRLTGRKQLAQGAFGLQFIDVSGKRVATLAVRSPSELIGFPPDADIRVKLVENKLVEVLRFGTIAKPLATADLSNTSFRAPSCQVRIVSRLATGNGMLLGSTNPWTLKTGSDPDGILLFQPADIQPRLWKLDIRESGNEQPILYLDERIPDASIWAKSDPVFAASVLPHVVSEIMRKVLSQLLPAEDGWEADWLAWAAQLMPGEKPPFGRSDGDKSEWIDSLVGTFSKRHALADHVLESFGGVQ